MAEIQPVPTLCVTLCVAGPASACWRRQLSAFCPLVRAPFSTSYEDIKCANALAVAGLEKGIKEGRVLALGHKAAGLGLKFLDSLLNLLPFAFYHSSKMR